MIDAVTVSPSDVMLGEMEIHGAVADTARYLMNNYGAPKAGFVSGRGATLIDENGREVLDFLGGIAVCSLGHCPPSVSDAIAAQAHKLIHTSNYFANLEAPKVAYLIDRLVAPSPGEEGRVFFANSGAEVNEAAIKLARRYAGPERTRVVGLKDGFHGRTMGALSATGQEGKKTAFQPLVPGFSHVEAGDTEALEAELAKGGVAAVIMEPILGEAGVIEVPAAFIASVRELCDQFGALLILDEVQTGFGRTGKWFAFQHFGVKPDVVTMAKAIASGFPVGALWARAEVAKAFLPGDHGTTFGGQPLAMAAALATITTMIDIDAPALAAERGASLARGLASTPGIASVSGKGLLLGATLKSAAAPEVAKRSLELGLIVNAIGTSVLRFAPPLVVTEFEIDRALEILKVAIS